MIPVGAQEPAKPIQPERFKLDNGLTVLLRPVKGVEDVALVVLYSLGGDHDPRGKSGLAHLVEHVYITAAAGTTKFRSAQDVFERYVRGANFQTGDRYTVLATVFPKKDLQEELKDAAARMGDLRPAEINLKWEVPRVLDELANMFSGFPRLTAWNHARELVRPTPLGGRKGGVPAHVKAITLAEIQARWRAYYRPNNAVLVLAGAIDPAAARKAVTERFGKIPAGEAPPPAHEPGKPQPGPLREVTARPIHFKWAAEATLAYAAPGPNDPLFAPFLVLVSRMQQRGGPIGIDPEQTIIRYYPLDDPGAVYVTAPLKNKETGKEAVARLEAFVAKSLGEKFAATEPRVARALQGFLFGFGDQYEERFAVNVYSLAFAVGRREQMGFDSEAIERALNAVTAEDVGRATREIFTPERRAAVVVYPAKGK
jgi:zinc protease